MKNIELFESSSWEDLEKEIEQNKRWYDQIEKKYRQGYWHGVRECIKLLKRGATMRQLNWWFWEELKNWCYGDPSDCDYPPYIVPWRELSNAIIESYDFTCAYCGEEATETDHVIPVSRGGGYELENLVASCKNCNRSIKHNKTPSEAGLQIIYPQVRDVMIKPGMYAVYVHVDRHEE